jgi:hypothetical protein
MAGTKLTPMRLLLFSFLLLTAFTVRDQDAQLYDRKWYLGYMRLNGQVIEPPLKVAPNKRPWLYFGKDHSYRQSLDNVTESGIWSYNEQSRQLTTTVQQKDRKPEVTVFMLRKLSADSLELEDPDGSIMGMVSR